MKAEIASIFKKHPFFETLGIITFIVLMAFGGGFLMSFFFNFLLWIDVLLKK